MSQLMDVLSKFPRWIEPVGVDVQKAEVLAKELNISLTLAQLLFRRGIYTFEEAKKYFRPSLKDLHDPFLMKDMDRAVDRLIQALEKGERIMIYGDYDVDGTTSVALVYSFLSTIHPHLLYYIPDRYKEGYGVSLQGMHWAKEKGVNLIISLDCGIKSFAAIELCNEQGMDFIVCDHHKPDDKKLPPAHAVLDAKRNDCSYPYKELSGCGVGFKLLTALCQKTDRPFDQLVPYLDLVVISIAADIVPITGENRVLAYHGLKQLNASTRAGIRALVKIAGFKKDLNISNVVFGLAPRINAAGRIDHAFGALELLLEKEEALVMERANQVDDLNSSRKDFDQRITEEALAMIEAEGQLSAKTTVLFKEDWHKGVIGIVASRCIEKYYRPTVILTESQGMATGSARSVRGFDLHEAISQCEDLLEQFGGHMYAAGLTLKKENVPAFKARFEQVVSTSIQEHMLHASLEIDEEIPLSRITEKFFQIVEQMAPFGPGNMQPVFVVRRVKAKAVRLLKEQHLKFEVCCPETGQKIVAIGFQMAEFYKNIEEGKYFDLCFQIQENEYLGQKTLQLLVKDVKFVE
ncbi:MAG TPA: single-stranded-DNA-specific exonuclease RecJ [Cytophagaceae bacterium]|nr:single-stranded-DNA-specific exonuclease RecJ [Cytophagaceae bacterium]